MTSGAILAGGRSSRFGGRDKRTLLVGGRSFLHRQLSALSCAADEILIVCRADAIIAPEEDIALADEGPRGRHAGAPGVQQVRVRYVTDRRPDRGPLGGLDAALHAARGERVLLLACDMPFVTAPFLAHLLRLAAGADAVVPVTGGRWHPLCAAYSRACAPAVADRLAAGDLRMTDLFRQLRVRAVPAAEIEPFGDPERLLANVNTPGDLDRALALHRHDG